MHVLGTHSLIMKVKSRQGVERLGNKSLYSGWRKGWINP